MATKIESDVSGSMWKLIAQPGDMVEADAEIAIIESMKMEIPVVAPRAGKLARFLVAEGEAVAEGQVVAEIEYAPNERACPQLTCARRLGRPCLRPTESRRCDRRENGACGLPQPCRRGEKFNEA